MWYLTQYTKSLSGIFVSTVWRHWGIRRVQSDILWYDIKTSQPITRFSKLFDTFQTGFVFLNKWPVHKRTFIFKTVFANLYKSRHLTWIAFNGLSVKLKHQYWSFIGDSLIDLNNTPKGWYRPINYGIRFFYSDVHTVQSPRATRSKALQSKRLSLCGYVDRITF